METAFKSLNNSSTPSKSRIRRLARTQQFSTITVSQERRVYRIDRQKPTGTGEESFAEQSIRAENYQGVWEREESINHRADLGLEDDGDASHGKAPQAAAGRSSRMPQSRNQSSPGEPPPPPPSAGAGGRDIAAAAEQWRDLSYPLVHRTRSGPQSTASR